MPAGKKPVKQPATKRLALISLRTRKRTKDAETGLEWITEVADGNPDLVTADGFESDVLGVCNRCGSAPVVAYDYDKCVDLLIQRDGMEHEDAVEFMAYNVVGAYVGEGTPVFISMRR